MNIRELASLAGVSKTTVAYALQNNPRVSRKTRENIQALAKENGYTTSPAINSFMRDVRRGKINAYRHSLAYISSVDEGNMLRRLTHSNERELLEGAQHEAKTLGCDLDIIDWSLNTADQVRLSQIITARGIQGIFLGAATVAHTRMHLDWDNIAVITSGYTVVEPPMDRTAADLFSALFDAGQLAIERNYQQVIITTNDPGSVRVGWRWLAAAATLRELHGDRIQLLRGDFPEMARKIIELQSNNKPTVVLGHSVIFKELKLLGVRIPQDMGFVAFDLLKEEPNISAIIQPHYESGRQALRHLYNAVENGVFGIPKHPCRLSVKCGWHEGVTLPAIS